MVKYIFKIKRSFEKKKKKNISHACKSDLNSQDI